MAHFCAFCHVTCRTFTLLPSVLPHRTMQALKLALQLKDPDERFLGTLIMFGQIGMCEWFHGRRQFWDLGFFQNGAGVETFQRVVHTYDYSMHHTKLLNVSDGMSCVLVLPRVRILCESISWHLSSMVVT